jgi:hypothetical protein
MEQKIVKQYYRSFWSINILHITFFVAFIVCIVVFWNSISQDNTEWILPIFAIMAPLAIFVMYVIKMTPIWRDLPAVRRRKFEKSGGNYY